VDHTAGGGSTAEPRLEIDATVDIGQIRVINSDTASIEEDRGSGPRFGSDRFGREDLGPLREAQAIACATG
jgi:hypothetical protein